MKLPIGLDQPMGNSMKSVSEEEELKDPRKFRNQGNPEKKLLLLGTSNSGKTTLCVQLLTLFNEDFNEKVIKKETAKRYNSIKVWFSTIETAYNIMKVCNLIGMEKECKEVLDFYDHTLSGTPLGFERIEDKEYGTKQLIEFVPVFSKIIELYKNYDTRNLLDQVRRNTSDYFDGMEQ